MRQVRTHSTHHKNICRMSLAPLQGQDGRAGVAQASRPDAPDLRPAGRCVLLDLRTNLPLPKVHAEEAMRGGKGRRSAITSYGRGGKSTWARAWVVQE